MAIWELNERNIFSRMFDSIFFDGYFREEASASKSKAEMKREAENERIGPIDCIY